MKNAKQQGILCDTILNVSVQNHCPPIGVHSHTCGVHNLHGMPGLLGGLIAIAVVPGIAVAQLTGIVFTVALALAGGSLCGFLISLTGKKEKAYEDADEFEGA